MHPTCRESLSVTVQGSRGDPASRGPQACTSPLHSNSRASMTILCTRDMAHSYSLQAHVQNGRQLQNARQVACRPTVHITHCSFQCDPSARFSIICCSSEQQAPAAAEVNGSSKYNWSFDLTKPQSPDPKVQDIPVASIRRCAPHACIANAAKTGMVLEPVSRCGGFVPCELTGTSPVQQQ